MKILSYKQDGKWIRVLTDNPGRPEFVYEFDRFASIDGVIAEIERSIAFEVKRAARREEKRSRLTTEFDARVADDARER